MNPIELKPSRKTWPWESGKLELWNAWGRGLFQAVQVEMARDTADTADTSGLECVFHGWNFLPASIAIRDCQTSAILSRREIRMRPYGNKTSV